VIAVLISEGFSWLCVDCGVAWPGPARLHGRVACPHCGDWCKAEVWGMDDRQVEWRPAVCSVPWNACPGCSRPWEYFEGERRCFHCDIAHVGGTGDGCSDTPTTVVLIAGEGRLQEGDTRIFCACHTAMALQAMPGSHVHVDLGLYELPAPTAVAS
jgi:hypothetical protein